MKKHDRKPDMNPTPEINNPNNDRDSKSFYARVWEGASTVITAASGDFSSVFSKPADSEVSTSLNSSYNSKKLQGVKGNWNIIAPKAAKKAITG
ncbi:hypothetical protein [Bdellovibrio sp. HCB337]|uniref:hypothetical protein n=1 Tax=Bdellovibrio sp. HCB337 TaxID=3394358 RepID=UPI0039A521E2